MSERPSPPSQRRSSFVDFFSKGNSTPAVSSSPPSGAVPPSPTTSQHRRGISISTLGLTGGVGGAQGQNNPYTAFARQRRASVATSSASSSPEFKNSFSDETAVIEEDDNLKQPSNTPASPFGRRLSFGAQALRDVKSGNSGSPGAGRRPSSSLFTLDENQNGSDSLSYDRKVSSGTAKTSGEGFNWSEALRDRTKRSPSFSSGNPFTVNANKARTASANIVEPPKEMPKAVEPQPLRQRKPDHLGERMLRGDFMMD